MSDLSCALKETLVSVIKQCYQNNWSPATSGNYSCKASFNNKEDQIYLTPSGFHKGLLMPCDLITLNLQGEILHLPQHEQKRYKTSAETQLHLQIYNAYPESCCVLHIHSPYATLMSLLASENYVALQGLELQKIFPQITTHESSLEIVVVPNHQNMEYLTQQLVPYLLHMKQIPAYLIKGHGLYTWANSIEQTFYQLEALEAMFQLEYLQQLTHRHK